VQLECPPHHVKYSDFDIDEEYRGDWERFGFFKLESACDDTTIRAYSMANYPEEKGMVKFNIRIATPPPGSEGIPAGVMSSWVFNLKPGDKVKVYGPFGEFFAQGYGRGDGVHWRRRRHGAHAFALVRPAQASA
jgi:Na+-transporting NADH:ubiquinone oxidoreductase subunit F